MAAALRPNSQAQDVSKRLHSTVAQQLTAASLVAHVLSERLDAQGYPEAAIAKELMGKLNLASAQLRDIMIECAGDSGS
jgi:hypothetical protein